MTDLRKAAEMALEALEGALSDDQPYIEKSKKAAEALRQALAQPEQEPVAWMYRGYFGDAKFSFAKAYAEVNGTEITPLYTAPPKREWVGLTDADKQEAFDETQEASGGFWEFADYLDAKLKEKNGG